MSNGAIYIVTQDPRYVDLLRTSAERLKTVMPDLPITVFSQFPVNGACYDRVIHVEPSGDGFYDKTRLIRESPYDQTIFVDADIYVAEPFPELFSLLDRFDCAATHEEYLDTDWFHRYPRPDIPASFPEFNTGILLFKRSALMDRVLVNWAELYKRFLEENPNLRSMAMRSMTSLFFAQPCMRMRRALRLLPGSITASFAVRAIWRAQSRFCTAMLI